jgi:hypothetical protein
MVNRRVGFYSVVAMALCALLSLLTFLVSLILMASSGGALAFVGLVAALACPAVWLTVLFSNDGGGVLAHWVKRAGARLQSSARRDTERQVQRRCAIAIGLLARGRPWRCRPRALITQSGWEGLYMSLRDVFPRRPAGSG